METALRVAVVGSGPAGFYTVQHLFKDKERAVQVDMFDRLPTPFGLVRFGVAPDHPKIKSVVAVYDRLARDPRFRFFGNVAYGTQLTLEDLRRHYHATVFCTGAQTDRALGIPGEDLAGSHPATEFVAWYNGHPDFVDHRFDLEQEAAVVVGVGNVAVDVARVLCRDPDELARTDIADHALDALRKSKIREVYLLGRRGPAQAAFTNQEVKELGQLSGTETSTVPAEMQLDPVSKAAMEQTEDKMLRRKLSILEGFAGHRDPACERKLRIRFLVSPVEILGDDQGAVRGVRIVRNELYSDGGKIRSRATEDTEILDAGLVFRSVGYHGVALAALPFDDWHGVVPNDRGRVTDPDRSRPVQGLYVSGWIKRGPSGIIGTNKPDAVETVECLLEDAAAGTLRPPEEPEPAAVERTLTSRTVTSVSYEDWLRLDAIEIERGKAAGRPRVKMTRLEEFVEALDTP